MKLARSAGGELRIPCPEQPKGGKRGGCAASEGNGDDGAGDGTRRVTGGGGRRNYAAQAVCGEETHVLHAGGMAVVDSAESGADRATLSGKVIFHVLYTQGAPNQVHVVEATADFIHQCDLPGAQPKGRVQAQARVEHVDASVQGGRLNMRAIVQLDARGASTQALEVLTGVNAPGGAEVATQEIALRRTVASGQADTLLREEFELPEGLQVRETLCADAAAQISDITGGQGRIGVEGTVTISAVHASDLPGKPLVVTHHEALFSQTLELSGESGDLLDARVTVRDVAVASQDAGDGGKTLRAEVLLGVQGTADTQEKLTVLRERTPIRGRRDLFRARRGDSHGAKARLCR